MQFYYDLSVVSGASKLLYQFYNVSVDICTVGTVGQRGGKKLKNYNGSNQFIIFTVVFNKLSRSIVNV